MTCNLTIGNQLQSRFIAESRSLALNGAYDEMETVSNKLNKALFNGGPESLKSFGQLFSVENPSSEVIFKKMPHLQPVQHNIYHTEWATDGTSHDLVTIQKKPSGSAKYALIEGIPLIGSIFAIFGAIKHAYSMHKASKRLKEVSADLIHMKSSRVHMKSPQVKEAELQKSTQVFDAALDYTSHKNYLKGSLLSLIPFLKPITRLFQLATR